MSCAFFTVSLSIGRFGHFVAFVSGLPVLLWRRRGVSCALLAVSPSAGHFVAFVSSLPVL